jgi:hypothetical protein
MKKEQRQTMQRLSELYVDKKEQLKESSQSGSAKPKRKFQIVSRL